MTSLLSPLLFAFIPGYIADTLLANAHAIPGRPVRAHRKGTPEYAQQRNTVTSLLIVLWLVYELRQALDDATGPSSFYDLLGIDRHAGEETVKRAYRQLSRQHHPDRSGGDDRHFVLLRQAYEVLQDPVRRWAYDRFGPQVIGWPALKSVREHVREGLLRSVGFYIVSVGVMLLVQVTGQARHGSYWRTILLLALLTAELHLILAPSSLIPLPLSYTPLPTGLSSALPVMFALPLTQLASLPSRLLDRPQYQLIALSHHAFTTLGVGITQLAGIWSPRDKGEAERLREWQAVHQMIQGMATEANAARMEEIGALLSKDTQHRSDREAVGARSSGHKGGGGQRAQEVSEIEARLRSGVKQSLIDAQLASHPGISAHWREAMVRAAASNPGVTAPQEDRYGDLQTAAGIPLPPSPPPSPVLSPTLQLGRGARRRTPR